MTPAAIVFDFDGTITDTEWPVYAVVRDAFHAHGLELSIADWVDEIGRADNASLEARLEAALGRVPDASVVETAHARRRAWVQTTEVRAGVVAVLDAADVAGVPLAIASSSPMAWVEPHLVRLGLRDRFAALCTRDHVDRGKPAPDLFLAAAAALGVDPADALAIEDSRHGCTAAKTAGMTCVVVPNDITAHDPPDHADLLLESLADLPLARFGLA